MSHNHAAMGSMNMGGLPALIDFSKMYWAVVGSAIGVAALVNGYNHILYRQRMSAAAAGLSKPAKPKSLFSLTNAVLFAIAREASNFSMRIPIRNRIFRLPTVGRASLILANLVVLIVLCFYGFDMNDRWSREKIGFRCGFVTIAQIPLLFLLAGKNNIVGFLTGVSHERLNWIHRWCARCMLFTATIHMGYMFADWAPYDYIGVQVKENTIVQHGLVAWAVLVWMVFSSMAPIRGWCYEFFVLQHLVSFAVFIGFVYVHTPNDVHAYIWIPVGLFFFDRLVRALRMLYANLTLFHPKMKNAGEISGAWACKAEFTPLPHNTTRIVIPNPPISWKPGQYMFLSCHSIVPLQSHPFTVASIPADGRMEFLVKAQSGGTKRIFRHAERRHELTVTTERLSPKTVAIEGPYGCLRPLRQFDSVILLAGSTGATFTVPLLRDILQGWKEKANSDQTRTGSLLFSHPTGAVTRHIRFVWVVKSKGQLGWFSEQLSEVFTEFQALQDSLRDIKLEMTVYVTCDDSFTEEHKTWLSSITAPNHNPIQKSEARQRYPAEFRSRTPSQDYEKLPDTKEEDIRQFANSIASQSSSNNNANACGPDGTCCCKTTIDESSTSPDAITTCCCSKPAPEPVPKNQWPISSTPSTLSAPSFSKPTKLFIHPSISVFSGRPSPRNIIRKSLEQAMGESAVVVCGPQGLVADVKRDVCALSDERAVHKGTGAQGIYLHTESFGY